MLYSYTILFLPSIFSSLSPRWKSSPSSSLLSRRREQSDGNHDFFSLNQPYYTRPEDFSISSYSPPKGGESKERSFVPPSILHQGSLGFFPPSSHISPPSSKPRFQYPQSFPYPYETPSLHPTPPPSTSYSIPSSTPSQTNIPSSPSNPPFISAIGPIPPTGYETGTNDDWNRSNHSKTLYPSPPSQSTISISPYFSGKISSTSTSSPYTPEIRRPSYSNPSTNSEYSLSTAKYPTLNPNYQPFQENVQSTQTNGYNTPVSTTDSSSVSSGSPSNFPSTTQFPQKPKSIEEYSTSNPYEIPRVSNIYSSVSPTVHYEGDISLSGVTKGVSSPPAIIPPLEGGTNDRENEPYLNHYSIASSYSTNGPISSQSPSPYGQSISTSVPNGISTSSLNGYESDTTTSSYHPELNTSSTLPYNRPSPYPSSTSSSNPYVSPSDSYTRPSELNTPSRYTTSKINDYELTYSYSPTSSYPSSPYPSSHSDYNNPSSPTVSPSPPYHIPSSTISGPLPPPPNGGIYSVDCIDCTPKPSNISIYSPPKGGPKFIIHNETGSPSPPSSNPYSYFSTVSPGDESTVSYDQPPPPPDNNNETKVIVNRIKGMAHILCMDNGVEVNALTVRPFDGSVATVVDGKRKCVQSFDGQSTNVSVFFDYEECGFRKTNGYEKNSEWETQIVFTFPSSVDSFVVQCELQSLKYDKGSLLRRFEESLEEFQLIPIKIEQKASLPYVLWSLTEHNLTEVEIGTQQVMYFNLTPQTEAYGFHVRNCFVIDEKNGDRHTVIDRKGCSSDMAAFTHPQYNTIDDTITSDWMAFKLPDHDSLHISCSYAICPDFPSSSGDNSSFCSTIPSPPLCPRTIMSPFNSLTSYQALSKREAEGEMTQRVEASLPIFHSPVSPQFTCFSPFSFVLIPTFSSTSILIASALHILSRRFQN